MQPQSFPWMPEIGTYQCMDTFWLHNEDAYLLRGDCKKFYCVSCNVHIHVYQDFCKKTVIVQLVISHRPDKLHCVWAPCLQRSAKMASSLSEEVLWQVVSAMTRSTSVAISLTFWQWMSQFKDNPGIIMNAIWRQIFSYVLVSSPDPPHHTQSENFSTGSGVEGLGMRLAMYWVQIVFEGQRFQEKQLQHLVLS